LEASRSALLADAELAKLDVERCRVTAPFTGEVVSVSVDVGATKVRPPTILKPAEMISTLVLPIKPP